MKLTALIFTAALFSVSAKSLSQSVTYSGNKVSLEHVFSVIEKQTGYLFLYQEVDLAGAKPVTIKVNDQPLLKVLDEIFKNQPLEYIIRSKTISVFPKHKPALAFTPIQLYDLHEEPIRGRVVDDAGNPLTGATVSLKGNTERSVATGSKGEFSIQAGAGDVLMISFVGYQPVELILTDALLQSVKGDGLLIRLQPASAAMQEVVVNKGYYAESRKLSTSSVSKVGSREIALQPVTNVMGALSGRVPGMQIVQSSGAPGAGFTVLIRGRNSLAAGNDPLYIVDGVPFASQSLGDPQVSRSLPASGGGVNPLNSLNPSDILSIEVLKDADATAIYGSRGANGVILITTKKGKAGKTKMEINMSTGFSEISRKVDLMNTEEYLAMRKEAFANDGITAYRPQDVDVNGTWDPDRYTDWQEELIGGRASTLNLQGAVSGGSQYTQFLLRGSYQRETTVMPGDFRYGRGAAMFNMVHRSQDDRFHLSLSNTYTTDDNNAISTDLTRAATTLPPNAPALYNEDGTLNWANGTWDNPLAMLQGKYKGSTRNMTVNAVADYRLLKGLTLKASLGYNDYRLNEILADPSTIYNPAYGLNSRSAYARATTGFRQSWIIEPQLSYERSIAKGVLNVLAGTTFQQQTGEQQSIFAYDFPSNSQIFDLAAAVTQRITGRNEMLYKYQAVFGRINYNWDRKYILNLTGRRDGSSRFGPGRQFADFGALGAAWIMTEENFMKDAFPFLSFAKLRGSYGVTGNDQIGDYQYYDTYQSTAIYYQGAGGLRSQRLYNPDFGWETNRKLEAGLDLGFLNDRIYIAASFYRNRSSNQLVGIPLPGTTGFSSIQANLGATVQNTGWELELRTVNIQKTKLRWNSAFNLSIPRNKLIAFPGLEGSTYASQYVIGKPLTILRLFTFTGYDPVTGKYLFQDVNKDGHISLTDDRNTTRDLSPRFFGGLDNSLSIGNWQIDVFVQFVKQEARSFLAYVNVPGNMQNKPTAVSSRYPFSGESALVQRYTVTSSELSTAHYNLANSDKGIVDGSYMRLKNLSVSYQLKPEWLGTAQCRIFVQAQNLLTITDYDGGDPESAYNFLPTFRTVMAGFQFSF